MKKIMFLAAIALCAMSCGNKAQKACEGECCQEEAVVCEEVVEEVVDSAEVVVEEVVEEAAE